MLCFRYDFCVIRRIKCEFFLYFCHFQARGYAQARPKVASAASGEVQITTLPNKVVVASLDGNAPVSRVSVAYRQASSHLIISNNFFLFKFSLTELAPVMKPITA